ncbi:MAG TPA: CocE/NonD family hydrolase [Solirubrobacterales bacterium]
MSVRACHPVRFLALGAVATAALVVAAPAYGAPSFEARGSVQQVYAVDVPPRAKVALLDRRGKVIKRKRATPEGGVLFRRVKPGRGYRVRVKGEGASGPLRVLTKRPKPPDESIYNQSLPSSGYTYIETRDGTKLAAYVHPAEDVTKAFGIELPALGGKRPVLIEYAGYGYADPDGPESGISLLANLMGFTVVDVNMRGTGCSGGAFDFFEPLQALDGYDVIETVARQPWAANGQVGMLGISYGGISQLFTAATRPPSLAAITPLSVIDGVQTTLYPGGILNTGFALEWAKDRVEDAKPAGPNSGQPWAWERIEQGDQICKRNQALHGEAVDLLRKIRNNRTYKPRIADPLTPAKFVHRIDVPTFMACQWTDEQTGGWCPNLASRFTGTDKKWFTFTNGTHVDALSPWIFNRLYDFLKIYVAKQAPLTSFAVIQAAAPIVYDEAMGISGVTLPVDTIQLLPTLGLARSAFEALPQVRVLFENGAGGSQPGLPYPRWEATFDSFPPPRTKARTWFLAGKGRLADRRPGRAAERSFKAAPHAGRPTNFEGDTGAGNLWTAAPTYDWKEHPAGTSASWITKPLERDIVVIGRGAVRVWVRSAKPDVDLQATISEVRPDGKEVFVQNGWIRASMRQLDRKNSTRLEPVFSGRARDMKPMPRGRFARVTIPLYYQGHAYRKGSRIRVTISGANGDQPVWAFARAKPRKGETKVTIASSKRRPSRLDLPWVGGVHVPGGLPPCPGLRGQPCRDYAG